MLPCRGILKERTDRRDRRAWHKDEAAQEELKGAIEAVLHELHNEHHEVPFLAQYRKEVRSKFSRACERSMGGSAEQQPASLQPAGHAKNSMQYRKAACSERPALHSMQTAGTLHGKWDVRACAVPCSTRISGETQLCRVSLQGHCAAWPHRTPSCKTPLFTPALLLHSVMAAHAGPAICTDTLETATAILKLCNGKCSKCSLRAILLPVQICGELLCFDHEREAAATTRQSSRSDFPAGTMQVRHPVQPVPTCA